MDLGTLILDLIGIADSLYGVRDTVGANKELTFQVTRTWTGATPGDGTFTDVVKQVAPSPAIANLGSSWKARQAGLDESGDTMLSGLSKQSYPTRETIDCTSKLPNVERFYMIAHKLYSVVNVEEQYISWTVRIRKVAHQG
jgi:hypothetical protein